MENRIHPKGSDLLGMILLSHIILEPSGAESKGMKSKREEE